MKSSSISAKTENLRPPFLQHFATAIIFSFISFISQGERLAVFTCYCASVSVVINKQIFYFFGGLHIWCQDMLLHVQLIKPCLIRYEYIYFCKKSGNICVQTFQLIFSDIFLLDNKVCMFCFSFLLSPLSSVILIYRIKRNYVNFDAVLRLNICESGVDCTKKSA